MSIYLKRTVFFFCILCLGLGCCLGDAKGDFQTFISNIQRDYSISPTREISGFVLENGMGLAGVVIYDQTVQVAVTDKDGYYEIKATHFSYTLIPRKDCYQFNPPTIDIPANQYNQKQDFTAEKTGCITISGNVIWKNYSDVTTIQSNPLPGDNNLTIPAITVAMEACSDDGSPCSRIVAAPDGTYSIPVSYNWSGSVKPSSLGFEFNPAKLSYSGLKVNKTQQNFQAPLSPGGSVYKFTVLVKDEDGNLMIADQRIYLKLEGTNHAKGGLYQYFTIPQRTVWPFYLMECVFSSIPSGWIGDIIPTSAYYTFSPASIRLEGIITEDRTFTFTAKPLDPIVFSGTIIWEYAGTRENHYLRWRLMLLRRMGLLSPIRWLPEQTENIPSRFHFIGQDRLRHPVRVFSSIRQPQLFMASE